MPTSSSKPPAPAAIRTTSPCCWASARRLFNPYLAYETLGRLVDTHAIAKDYRTVMLNYRNGINKGLYKIMSKSASRHRLLPLLETV
ncbi:glutamate synthase central domain-containing protein [Escherichia coli]